MRRHAIPFSGASLKQRLLHWASSHRHCVFLDSCGSSVDAYGEYDFLIGVAQAEAPSMVSDLKELDTAVETAGAWWFGYLNYDLKSEIEPRLHSDLQAEVKFPTLSFFQADIVITKRRDSAQLVFETGFSPAIWEEILWQEIAENTVADFSGFASNFDAASYCATVERLRQHIHAGDCYEINLSQNFTAKAHLSAPAALWERLVALSPVPFAGFGKWQDLYLLCASPERFLQLQHGLLRTQPIKGTAPRSPDAAQDLAFAQALQASEKERAENVMIVDLSRNDLHRSCEVGSVTVPHLFEVQQFPQVHHLVSTIEGRKRAEVSLAQVMRHTFPPGSMTGAPKVRTCELIARYEQRARGLYAGALGYIAPSGDFDFNVVIRSLVYDASSARISYHVGGAITWDSVPEAEYAETLLKAKAIAGLF
jgi:para-aminobenzoate synthetase component I